MTPTIDGDVLVRSSGVLDLIYSAKIEKNNGDLIIYTNYSDEIITSLKKLSFLNEITGSLSISYLRNIKNLEGLENLKIIGGSLILENNSKLENISA